MIIIVSDAWYNTAVGQLTQNYLLQTIWTLLSPHLTRQVRDTCISGRLGSIPRQKPKVASLIPFSFSAEIAAYEACLHKQKCEYDGGMAIL